MRIIDNSFNLGFYDEDHFSRVFVKIWYIAKMLGRYRSYESKIISL